VFISGINILYDQFRQQNTGLQNARSFTTGLYMQDTWDITEKVKLESGIRFDNATYHTINYRKNQFFFLPRVSALFKFSDKISSRIGGGLGYKIPSIFIEQTEALQYRDVLPLKDVTAEKSAGITADVDYKTTIAGVLSFSINQLFFYTAINNPLVLRPGLPGTFYFANAASPVNSKGFETNLKFIYKQDLKLFIGYTHIIARANYQPVNKVIPLQPQNKLNLTLMYEKEDNFKLGLEAYLTGNQYLYNNTRTPSFWEFGFMAQKTFKKVSCFINFENFTDQRQSRYKTVANAPHSNPGFDDIWNHTEGFICNGGIKIKL
jgi:outer membrane receptor for ferrienterochelin and colicins